MTDVDHGKARIRLGCERHVATSGGSFAPAPDRRQTNRPAARANVRPGRQRTTTDDGPDQAMQRRRHATGMTRTGEKPGQDPVLRLVVTRESGPAPTGTNDRIIQQGIRGSTGKSERPARQRRPDRLPRRAKQMNCVATSPGSMS